MPGIREDIKERWIEDLRRDDVYQAEGALREKIDQYDNYAYCCLGRLCDLHHAETPGSAWSSDGKYCPHPDASGDPEVLPSPVVNWAGMYSDNPEIDVKKVLSSEEQELYRGGRTISLAELNDGVRDEVRRRSFDEIADIIEEHFYTVHMEDQADE